VRRGALGARLQRELFSKTPKQCQMLLAMSLVCHITTFIVSLTHNKYVGNKNGIFIFRPVQEFTRKQEGKCP
jgi:hypothetical protein